MLKGIFISHNTVPKSLTTDHTSYVRSKLVARGHDPLMSLITPSHVLTRPRGLTNDQWSSDAPCPQSGKNSDLCRLMIFLSWKQLFFAERFGVKSVVPCFGLGVVFPHSNYCLVCPSHCQMMPHCKYSQTTREARWWKKNQFGHFFVHAFLLRPRLQTIFCEYFEYYDTKVTILTLSPCDWHHINTEEFFSSELY